MQQTPEFDKYSADYAELVRHPIRDRFSSDGMFFHRRKWDLIREFFRGQGIATQNMDWIDVGCGRGELLEMGRAHFRRVTGCDVSGSMLPAGAQFECIQQDNPERLPFPDGSCDFITAVCVFHHVEEMYQGGLLAEMHRVLRPGGYAGVIEHNPHNPVTAAMVRRIPVDANAVLLPPKRLRQLLAGAGLRHVDTTYFLYLPEPLYGIAGGVERVLARLPLGGQYAGFAMRPR